MRSVRGLYPIVDVDVLQRAGQDPVAFLRAVLVARPALVQLRAKHLGGRETLELLHGFRRETRAVGVRLFANDRPDLAHLADCDGVHLGQTDLPMAEVRRCFPKLMVGLSTHSLEQLEEALDSGPDYVAFGPVFQTASKRDPDPVVGLSGLSDAANRARGRCPLVAIGGIDRARAALVAPHADLAAVIGALVPDGPGDAAVSEVAVQLQRVLVGSSS